MGCRTVVVHDGSEALRCAMGNVRFDVIYLDLSMPLVDGPDACVRRSSIRADRPSARMLRSTNNINMTTPLVAVSAFTDLSETNTIWDAVMSKPVSSVLSAPLELSLRARAVGRSAPRRSPSLASSLVRPVSRTCPRASASRRTATSRAESSSFCAKSPALACSLLCPLASLYFTTCINTHSNGQGATARERKGFDSKEWRRRRAAGGSKRDTRAAIASDDEAGLTAHWSDQSPAIRETTHRRRRLRGRIPRRARGAPSCSRRQNRRRRSRRTR